MISLSVSLKQLRRYSFCESSGKLFVVKNLLAKHLNQLNSAKK